MQEITESQAKFIQDDVIPIYEVYKKHGIITRGQIPNVKTLNEVHTILLGFRANMDCSNCVANAMKMVVNKYNEISQAKPKTPVKTKTVDVKKRRAAIKK